MKQVDDPDLILSPISVAQLVFNHPAMRPVVVDGLLRQGETANIIASPKIGKSFLMGNLAWCVATGRPWLGHDVIQGRVLIIDNELHPETLANRLDRIANEMQVSFEDRELVDVIALRGQNVNINELSNRLAEIDPRHYALIGLDALYRTIPAGMSENDNAAMMAIYNRLDFYASKWQAAIAVVHHSSKGQQGDKAVTDVGAGAGAISRAADTHISIRPHEVEGLAVLEAVTRSFKSPEPLSVKFEWPIWSAVGLKAEVKKQGRPAQEQKLKADREAIAIILEKVPTAPKAIQQKALMEQVGVGPDKFNRLISGLARDKKITIHRKRKKGGRRQYVFYSQPQCNSDSDSDSDSV